MDDGTSEIKIDKKMFLIYKKGSIVNSYKIGKPISNKLKSAEHKQTNNIRAVKCFLKSDINEKDFFKLVDLYSNITHPNIPEVYEFYEDKLHYYIVMEMISGGELFDKITKYGCFSEKIASDIMKQILSAVCYLHEKGIIHRDICPENIMLDGDVKNLIIKVTNFARAQLVNEKKSYEIPSHPYYFPPELLLKNGEYTTKSDIFSCGVILYILLSGMPPFNGKNDKEILVAIKHGEVSMKGDHWDKVSSEAKELILKMLQTIPKYRFSAEECLAHNWFKKFDNEKDHVPLSKELIDNMLKFKEKNVLENATMTYIVTQIISKQEKSCLIKHFKSMDKNGDGKISRDELLEEYQKLFGEVKAVEIVEDILNNCDLNKDGFIDYNEFLVFALNKDKILSKENLNLVFQKFDKDQSGSISVDEILTAFNLQGTDEDRIHIEELLKKSDVNGDGELSIAEFTKMMESYMNN